MKIAILTLNPCIDRALYLSGSLRPGDIHRVGQVVENAAGKGLNQAVVLEHLGTECDYYSFGSTANDDAVSRFISSRGFRYHVTPAKCGIRTNIKVIDADGVGTELNEAGGPIQAQELAHILEALDRFDGEVVSVCGSIPQGVDKSVYKSLLLRAKEAGKMTVLDADGDALRQGLCGRPDYIKPNRRELAGLFDLPESALNSDDKVIELARRVNTQYGTTVLCTLDADGSICVNGQGVWRVGVAKVPLRGFSGAGDTYLAAFIHARHVCGADMEEALRFAARASGAKISLGGTQLPTREEIENMPDVVVERIF